MQAGGLDVEDNPRGVRVLVRGVGPHPNRGRGHADAVGGGDGLPIEAGVGRVVGAAAIGVGAQPDVMSPGLREVDLEVQVRAAGDVADIHVVSTVGQGPHRPRAAEARRVGHQHEVVTALRDVGIEVLGLDDHQSIRAYLLERSSAPGAEAQRQEQSYDDCYTAFLNHGRPPIQEHTMFRCGVLVTHQHACHSSNHAAHQTRAPAGLRFQTAGRQRISTPKPDVRDESGPPFRVRTKPTRPRYGHPCASGSTGGNLPVSSLLLT